MPAMAMAIAVALSAGIATATPGKGAVGISGRDGPGTFDISGSVQGLVPTVERRLPLLLENPDRRAIRVVSLEVDVGDPSGACTAEGLDLALPELPIIVPARSEVIADVLARLADGVDDACQGAVWPLAWTGTAERA